jgi:hypothetical protein
MNVGDEKGQVLDWRMGRPGHGASWAGTYRDQTPSAEGGEERSRLITAAGDQPLGLLRTPERPCVAPKRFHWDLGIRLPRGAGK